MGRHQVPERHVTHAALKTRLNKQTNAKHQVTGSQPGPAGPEGGPEGLGATRRSPQSDLDSTLCEGHVSSAPVLRAQAGTRGRSHLLRLCPWPSDARTSRPGQELCCKAAKVPKDRCPTRPAPGSPRWPPLYSVPPHFLPGKPPVF